MKATQMPGDQGCFLSFHTVKAFGVDTGVPDGAYASGCDD
jgi:hypothetical protein